MSDPKLYDDSVAAGKVVKERAKVESKLEAVKSLTSELQTWREMHGERVVRHCTIAASPTVPAAEPHVGTS